MGGLASPDRGEGLQIISMTEGFWLTIDPLAMPYINLLRP